jgi:uncharacterized membrane protein
MLMIEIGVAFVLIAGVFFKLFPPKKINRIYGWHSRYSVKSQSTWDESQRYIANSFIVTGIILIILGALQYLVFKNSIAATVDQVVEILLSVFLIYLNCERHLKKMFREDGSKRGKRAK